tara:strand:+ start:427 stop:939 length:513 start_codon:yes stop_codon:yes gene_type:complete
MSDVCQELQNIKYQTMLLNHNSKIYEAKPNVDNIEFFLENEKEVNKGKPWSKLSKAYKLKKISEYVLDYSKEKKLTDEQITELKKYLIQCLNRKKLQRQKDVVYDMDTNKIKLINGLTYNKNRNKFTLKQKDKKKGNTLKSLPPKKNKTKNKNVKKRRKKKNKIDSNIKE